MVPAAATPNLPLFFGRLHPLLVHLPIGFLAALAVLEIVTRLKHFKNAAEARGILLVLTALSAAAAATAGLLLSTSGGYDPHLLAWHKYMGLALAATCVLACVLYLARRVRVYTATLLLALLLLAPASHFGGSMTHGRDYLTQYAPAWFRAAPAPTTAPAVAVAEKKKLDSPDQAVVFTDLVEPILARNCLSCHNADKLKGGLRVDAIDRMKTGGDSGPALVPGKSADSLLVQRAQLPESDDDHMPPPGKPQPTPDQVALLAWWIDAGAPADKTLAQLDPPPDVVDTAAKTLGLPAPKPPRPATLADLAPAINKLTTDLGVVIGTVAPDQPWLTCNASVARNFGDAQLAQLAPLANNLTSLNLSATKVTDTGLKTVGAMPNLHRLRLERTKITDAGLKRLAHLRHLEYLNLYATDITPAGLTSLQRLPALKQLYLWHTKVDPESAKAFADARTDRAKIDRLNQRIRALQAEIADQRIEVVDGLSAPASATTTVATTAPTSAPATLAIANTVCPVSGKPVDPEKTIEFEGKRIAFCCDDCLAAFKKNPAKYKSKLATVVRAK